MFFFFYNQIYFPFSFSCTCLMGLFKKTEYSLICKVFNEVLLIARIPHSTVLITEAFCKKEVLKNFSKFTGKQSFFFIKVAKFLRTPFLKENLQWLLL